MTELDRQRTIMITGIKFLTIDKDIEKYRASTWYDLYIIHINNKNTVAVYGEFFNFEEQTFIINFFNKSKSKKQEYRIRNTHTGQYKVVNGKELSKILINNGFKVFKWKQEIWVDEIKEF